MVSALGLDIGQKRIGVAGSDPTGLLATGLTTVCRTTLDTDVDQLRAWVARRRVQVLVVGLPYTLSGERGQQAQWVEGEAQRFGAALALPLEWVDERLTSWAAAEWVREARPALARRARSQREAYRAALDQQAAVLILQEWLDRRRTHPYSTLGVQ